jgi:HEAT repeat protein
MKRIGLTLLALLIAGCMSDADRKPHPKFPPKYPRAVPTPIDPALQAKASAELASALASDDDEIRCNGIETLKDTTPAGYQSRLAAGLADRSLLVRKAACFSIGELKLTALKDQLKGPLNDLDELPPGSSPEMVELATQERVAAIFALAACGEFEHAHDLEMYARDPRERVRRDTVYALGLLGNKTALPVLADVLHNDVKKYVRVLAAEAMWRLGSEEGLKALVTATISSEPGLQVEALLGLALPRDSIVLMNVRAHTGDDVPDAYFEAGLMATRACGLLGDDIGYGVALKGADSKDWRQRVMAAYAFAAIGRPDDQPVLAKLLGDRDPRVRIAAARAVLMLERAPG